MTDEPESGDESGEAEYSVYEPSPVEICEGAVVIFDHVEFAEATKSIAAMNRDGVLFALRKDSLKWVNVESLAVTGAKLKTIK